MTAIKCKGLKTVFFPLSPWLFAPKSKLPLSRTPDNSNLKVQVIGSRLNPAPTPSVFWRRPWGRSWFLPAKFFIRRSLKLCNRALPTSDQRTVLTLVSTWSRLFNFLNTVRQMHSSKRKRRCCDHCNQHVYVWTYNEHKQRKIVDLTDATGKLDGTFYFLLYGWVCFRYAIGQFAVPNLLYGLKLLKKMLISEV